MSQEIINEFNEIEAEFIANFHSREEIYYYVVSKRLLIWNSFLNRWLDDWKAGSIKSRSDWINEDIQVEPKQILKYSPLDSHMWNIHVKKGLS
jgi:hypothetical protein